MTEPTSNESKKICTTIELIKERLNSLKTIKESAKNGILPIKCIKPTLLYGYNHYGAEVIDLDVISLDILHVIENHFENQLKIYEGMLIDMKDDKSNIAYLLNHDHTQDELERIYDLAEFGSFVAVTERVGQEELVHCSEETINEMVEKTIPSLISIAENFYEQLNKG